MSVCMLACASKPISVVAVRRWGIEMDKTQGVTNTKILIVSFVVWTLANMDQAFFGYALPGILAEFNLPLEAAGLILTISFVVASVMLVFTGIAADRLGRGPMLSLLLAVSAILVGFQGLAGGIMFLTLFRALGFGISSGLSPITNAYVAENVVPRYRGLAMGVLQCGYPLGWFIASLIAAPLLANYNWRVMCFAAFAVVPLALLFHWVLRDEQKAEKAAQPTQSQAPKGSISELFSDKYRKISIASMLTYFAFGGAYAGSAFFFPTFFVETRGYSQEAATGLVGLSNALGIVGYLLAAFVGEFVITRRNTFILWALGGTLALLGLFWLSPNSTTDMLWYGLTAALFYGSLAVLPVLIAEIFPQDIRASALSVCASAPLSLGFAVFPLIVPFVVGDVGWPMGFTLVICPLIALSAFTALFLPNRQSGLEMVENA